MENSGGKPGTGESIKKARSLDIQSLYKSSLTKEGHRKGKSRVVDSEEVRKKKRRSRKELPLSSLESAGKKSRTNLGSVYNHGLGSSLDDSVHSGLSQKPNESNGLSISGVHCVSLNLDGSGNVLRIPKRRRGTVGRNKFAQNHLLKPSRSSSLDEVTKFEDESSVFLQNAKKPETSSGAGISIDQVVKLNGDSGGKVVSAKVKRKKGLDDSKGKKRKELVAVDSSRHNEREDFHFTVNNGTVSSRKSRNTHRKMKDLASGTETVAEKAGPPVDNPTSTCDVFQEDDEENLEQNAARMLSSRFDPSCTGFSLKDRSLASATTNGSSFLVKPRRNLGHRGSVAGTESESADTASRVLRPRKQHKGKGFSRKRRHFYEISSRDLDPYWLLKQRIKVLWPLDDSWYYGLVDDYDAEKKLHHIKYDDRQEEWISLQNERFKLLLLPSEVPGKSEPKESAVEDNHTDSESRVVQMNDETCMGSHMESEPIISWLARVKSAPSGSLKKQKTSHPSSNVLQTTLSDRSDDTFGLMEMVPLKRETCNPEHNSAFAASLIGGTAGRKFLLERTVSYKEAYAPVVYVRRRFRRNNEGSGSGMMPANGDVHGVLPGADTSLASVDHNFQYLADLGADVLPWSINSVGMLELDMAFTESKEFRLEVHVPVRPLLNFALEAEILWLVHNILMLHCGTIMTMWPIVHLEVLFVDNIVGLRFFLFECCLKQAVAFVFLVLAMFDGSDKQGSFIDLQIPVTSVRFKLSCIHNFCKQQVFAFYSFSKVRHSNWLYLDSELQPHCLLIKQLSLSECTYDNVKLLEGGNRHLHTSSAEWNPSPEVVGKKTLLGIAPMGVARDSCRVNKGWPFSNSSLKHGILPPFALSFAAAPTFFISLHLKLLMECSISSISLRDHSSGTLDHSEYACESVVEDCSQVEDCSEDSPESTPGSHMRTFTEVACSRLSGTELQLGADAELVSTDGGLVNSSHHLLDGKVNVAGTSNSSKDHGNTAVDVIIKSEDCEGCHLQSEQPVPVLRPLNSKDGLPVMSSAKCYSNSTHMSVEIPPYDQVDKDINGKRQCAQQVTDMAWNVGDGIVCSPSPSGPRSSWHRNKSNSNSSSFGDLSHVSEGRADFIRRGFGAGPKKPRTQVQYTLPYGAPELSSKRKTNNQNSLPYKRIRRANERTSDGPRGSRRNLELLACDANLLITLGDKGWRECGARVFLEVADQNEWKLAVKLCGVTKYSYKVAQDLQPGSTNRYTHAMMWKGGKDWALEFPDRSQWMIFKEMHEECHNRNIRAASVKNIPIPGVRMIEEFDDAADMPFVRGPKYFCQVETDVDMAMDTSRILYDMDSDDEEWVVRNRKSMQTEESELDIITDELFEKTMDMFEKVSYAQQREHFTVNEIEELIVGVGPMEVIKVIYEHWRQKRQRKGMALIRQLQPPLWEKFEQQMKEWEQLRTKPTTVVSTGSQEKAPAVDKPTMYAFCLKPRGLEVINKGSKHRPQRKYSLSGHSHSFFGDQDGQLSFGRRLNGFPFGDEKAVLPSNSHESSDASPLLRASPRVFSPRDATGPGYFSLNGDASERNHHPNFLRNNSKKMGTFSATSNTQKLSSYSQRKTGNRNGVQRWNMSLPDWPIQKLPQPDTSYRHQIEQLGGSDLDEFRLRDASGAAKHALNMAKLKRERAQKLLYRADLAIHKAVVALMTAEAIKASQDSNADGPNGQR